jgi:hypothetical protein
MRAVARIEEVSTEKAIGERFACPSDGKRPRTTTTRTRRIVDGAKTAPNR